MFVVRELKGRTNIYLQADNGCPAKCIYCSNQEIAKKTSIFQQQLKTDNPVEKEVTIVASPYSAMMEDIRFLAQALKEKSKTTALSLGPRTVLDKSQLIELQELGIRELNISLIINDESIEKRIWPQHKDGSWWDLGWSLAESARGIFGEDKVAVTLGVGLAETEEMVMKNCQSATNKGIRALILPFKLDRKRFEGIYGEVSTGKLHRILIGNYLIQKNFVDFRKMQFNDFGQILNFGLSKECFTNLISNRCIQVEGLTDCSSFFGSMDLQDQKLDISDIIRTVCSVNQEESWVNLSLIINKCDKSFEDEIEDSNDSMYKWIAEFGQI